jgi:hypothetical protein
MHKKRPLDYLLIPESSGKLKKQREIRASEESKKRKIKKIIIMSGKDSEEDILGLGKMLKKGNRIGFDTFPLHFKEYKDIIKRARKEGKFPEGIKTEFIGTSQTPKEVIYGILGLEEERFEEKEVNYQKKRKGKLFQWLKNIIKKIINL